MKKFYNFTFMALVLMLASFASCSSSTDNVIEENVTKEQTHLEGVYNANSIIIHPGSNNWYGLDISRANTFWSNPDVGDATNVIDNNTEWTAEVIWQDIDHRAISFCGADGKVINGDTVNGKGLYPLHVKVTTSSFGNIVVGIKKKGESDYLWSWHLWLTEEPKEIAGFMDRNLGATSASIIEVSKTYGLNYQFGRKDAFTGDIPRFDINGKFIYAGDKTNDYGQIPLAQSVQKPDVWCGRDNGKYEQDDWVYRNNYLDKHWNDISESDGKTFFDPCPEGWRLPSKGDLKNLTMDKEQQNCLFVYDGVWGGWSLDGNFFFRISQYWSTGDIVGHNDGSIRKRGFESTVLSFNYDLVRTSYGRRVAGKIRCIKDTNL